MFWTRAILWKIIKVLGYLIGMVRYYPARKKKYFFCPILDTSTPLEAYLLHKVLRTGNQYQSNPVHYGPCEHRDHDGYICRSYRYEKNGINEEFSTEIRCILGKSPWVGLM